MPGSSNSNRALLLIEQKQVSRGSKWSGYVVARVNSSPSWRPRAPGTYVQDLQDVWLTGVLAVWQFERIWQCFIISLRPGFCILSAKFLDYGPCAWVTLMLSKMDLVLDLNLLGRLCVIYALVFRAAVDDWQRQLPANNYSSHLVIWVAQSFGHRISAFWMCHLNVMRMSCAEKYAHTLAIRLYNYGILQFPHIQFAVAWLRAPK